MSGKGSMSPIAAAKCWRRSEKESSPVDQKPQERLKEEGKPKPVLQCGLLFSSWSRLCNRSRDNRGGNSVGVPRTLSSLAGTEGGF